MMKILSVKPGHVFPWASIVSDSMENGRPGYGYTLDYETGSRIIHFRCGVVYSTAADAKQAMREKVHQERKRHGLQG